MQIKLKHSATSTFSESAACACMLPKHACMRSKRVCVLSHASMRPKHACMQRKGVWVHAACRPGEPVALACSVARATAARCSSL